VEILQAVFFGVLIGGMIICLGYFLQQRYSSVRRRLQVNPRLTVNVMRPRMEENSAFLKHKLVEKFGEKLGLGKNGPTVKRLQAKLIQAGIYTERAIALFLALKLAGLLVLPVLVLSILWGTTSRPGLLIVIPIILCPLGYILPNLILNRMISSRHKNLRESLPDALDLMVVCVEAGQGLDAAVKRVAEDLQSISPILAQELLLVNLEIMAGLTRQQAWKNLGERTGVEQLVSLCNVLIQSERFGTSIASALKTQSDYLRIARRQRLEGMAAKTPVKLVFPTLLFIFPGIMVVLLGPAIIHIGNHP
jgi:tight adherence protein C